jgi:hypothetical protein
MCHDLLRLLYDFRSTKVTNHSFAVICTNYSLEPPVLFFRSARTLIERTKTPFEPERSRFTLFYPTPSTTGAGRH